jgi:hypothetical protein
MKSEKWIIVWFSALAFAETGMMFLTAAVPRWVLMMDWCSWFYLLQWFLVVGIVADADGIVALVAGALIYSCARCSCPAVGLGTIPAGLVTVELILVLYLMH